MFKKILLILMIGLLGFGVVGCSDDLSEEELAKCEKEYSNLEKILDEITIVWFEEIFKGIYYENDNMEFKGDITNKRVVKVTFDEETLNKSKEKLKEKRKIVDDININRLKKYVKYQIKNDDYYKDITKKENASILKRTSDIRKILNKGLNIYEELLNKGEKLEYNEEECKELDNSFLKIHDMIDEEIPEPLR
ncbi:hypothetical protein KGF41_14590 [Clostridioides sp. ZZV14-6150]|uniref:hypothetical protein n=1 Tax=Clostridioides sp. ZZV14-6150 TaxID=2811493 RepID=UPI001D0FCA26|nr:hypothetical protein [Clostridioides sp. ZZV14-6150]